MKISSKNELHDVVHFLQDLLDLQTVEIKTTRLQEIFAQSLGFKSYNGLISSLPFDQKITQEQEDIFTEALQKSHEANKNYVKGVLLYLERDEEQERNSLYLKRFSHKSYCPSKLGEGENYWYLTSGGWKPWAEMVPTGVKVGINVYEVIRSHLTDFSGRSGPVWDSSQGTAGFEVEARRLKKRYGPSPDESKLFSRNPSE